MYVVFQCAMLGSSESAVKSAWVSGTIPNPEVPGFEDTVYGEITTGSGITDEKAQVAIDSIALIQIDSSRYARNRKITLGDIRRLPSVAPSRVISEEEWDGTVRPAWMRAASATSLATL